MRHPLALPLVVVMLLAGCSLEKSVPPTPAPTAPTATAPKTRPVVLVGEKNGSGMYATISGTLAEVDGCLGLAPAKSRHDGIVLILPFDTEVTRNSPFRVEIRGKTYELGDELRTGGGGIDRLDPESPLNNTAPKSCLQGNLWDVS